MSLLIGNVQGRLLPSPKNRLQYFPKKNWRSEFEIANKIRFDFIEFFSERKFNINNPIWNTETIKEYKNLCRINNLKIINFCDDHVISNSISTLSYKKYFKKLLTKCKFLGIKKIIIPLYGKSNLDKNSYKHLLIHIKKINSISSKFRIKLLIETNLESDYIIELFNKINSTNLKLLYDTGNRIINPNNSYNDIVDLKKYIDHIHIKDKTIMNKNVSLGSGHVCFNKIFLQLKKINYKKNFTFETFKSEDPIKTARNNMLFLNRYIRKFKLN